MENKNTISYIFDIEQVFLSYLCYHITNMIRISWEIQFLVLPLPYHLYINIYMSTINPFARPLYVMLKPAGSLCNLRCKYCYYLEKNNLYQDQKSHVISDQMLEKFIKEYIESQTTPDVLFCWHGGETLMRPISFYRKALELQRTYARGRRVDNSIQTNATLLTDEWCEFFR